MLVEERGKEGGRVLVERRKGVLVEERGRKGSVG